MDKLENKADVCADCGCVNPAMHNSREIHKPWVSQPVTQRFPGYLCVACWKLANPKLFEFGTTGRQFTKPISSLQAALLAMWALLAVCVVVGVIGNVIYAAIVR